MELNENLDKSVQYTRMLGRDSGNLLILIIINLIPIVNFITLGYAWEIIKRTPGSSELPPLRNFVDLWIKGLKLIIASIILMIIPLIIMAVTGGLFALSAFGLFSMTNPDLMTGIGEAKNVGMFAGTIVGIILSLIFGLFVSMALVHMIKHDDFGKIFAFGEVSNLISTIGGSKYFLWFIVIFVMCIVVAVIGMIPFGIGYLLSQIAGVFLIVFAARSAGMIYEEGVAI